VYIKCSKIAEDAPADPLVGEGRETRQGGEWKRGDEERKCGVLASLTFWVDS